VTIEQSSELDALVFTADGLIPVVAQDARTGELLMMAWADRVALEKTLDEGRLWFWSRQRRALWRKGESSGNEMRVLSLHADCDRDTVLALVEPAGPACHTGARTCFDASPALTRLADTIRDRVEQPDGPGYTRRLLSDENLRLKKIGEEAMELALACQSNNHQRTMSEAADVLYHVLVACAAVGVNERDILAELLSRHAERRRGVPAPHAEGAPDAPDAPPLRLKADA
jgi:phosphoribosyl-ATP pyrophosphohydrolase/phosphoribosyl-AMP cyclohydrolase